MLTKPDHCTCPYPEAIARNMNGHALDCPAYVALAPQRALTLDAARAAVVAARAEHTEHATAYREARAALEATLAPLKQAADDAANRLAELEGQLRGLALDAYKLTHNKKPLPGVGIREVTTLHYEPAVALHWARQHDLCLKLDDKAFEALAKTQPLPFVQVRMVPQATLSKEL